MWNGLEAAMFGKKAFEKILTKWNTQSTASQVKLSLGLLVGMFGLVLVFTGSLGAPEGVIKVNQQAFPEDYMKSLTTRYENCTVSLNAREQKSKPKLFWTPGFPDSINEPMLRNMVFDLTGKQAPAASYSVTRPRQRKCKNFHNNVKSLCLVDNHVNPEAPGAVLEDTFNGEVIVQLRNPRTWIPAHHNAKAIRFHQHQGQVSQDNWREFRNEFFEGILRNWVNFVRMFDNMSTFHVVMYLPMEFLMDATKGPTILNKLALILQKGGFETIIDANMVPGNQSKEEEHWACFWYQHMDRPTLERYTKYGYEYADFLPGFTTQQRNLMLQELETLLGNTQNTPELASILQLYYNDIRDNTPIDDP